ncbi:MAG: beta-ketoacyl-ACP synthase III [Cardiobacteriaceae bacterium]|nr:beta-ketoacyl-ACP synthase III [Cardiobacteriaceae bacterium]
MKYSRILSTGSYLPERVVSNDDLAQTLDTSDEWIYTRTGIKTRHIADPSQSCGDLAYLAAESALQQGNIDPKTLDLIIVATSTPEHIFPSDATKLQLRLGCRPIPAFDMQAACSGFIYALVTADAFIRSGVYRRVLVVGADLFSNLVDWNDRATAILFGDGAGAVVLEASDEAGILDSVLYSDGQFKDLLCVPRGHGTPKALWEERSPYIHMQGNSVFKIAVQSLSGLVTELLEKTSLKPEDLDFLVPHQANYRIIKATAEHLGMPLEKVIVTVHQHANTSAASIPLALDYGVRSGKIQRGHRLLLEAFGGGFAWGGCIIKY